MSSIEVQFQQAVESFRAGRTDDAEQRLKSVLKRQPSHLAALNILGVLLAGKKKYDIAERYLRSALKINSKSDTTLYNYGSVLKELSRPAEALEYFNKAVAINPSVAETWNNRGTVQNDLHCYEEALGSFDKAIALSPNYSAAFCNRGKSHERLNRYDEALAAYGQALALAPNLVEAWLGCGNVAANLQRYDDALAAYGRVLTLRPDFAEAWCGRGKILLKLERYEEARMAYERVLAMNQNDVFGWIGCGNALLGLKSLDEALAAFDKALELKPELDDAWVARGNYFYETTQFDQALAAYDRVLALSSTSPAGWLGRGNALAGLQRYDEAFDAFDKALALSPSLEDAWIGHGNILIARERPDEALSFYDKALAVKPNLVKAWMGRGHALFALRRYDQAVPAYNRILSGAPNHLGALLSRGQAFLNLKRYQEALADFDKALELKPDLMAAWHNRAIVFFTVKQYREAFLAYDKLLNLDPDFPSIEGYRLVTKMHLCDWSDMDEESRHLLSSVREGHKNAIPFGLLGIGSSSSDQLLLAQRWAAPEVHFAASTFRGRHEQDRIRLAYLSPDFREHAVSYVLAGVLEAHDRTRFEVIGLSAAANDNSEMQKRIRKSFDQWFDVGEKTDEQLAGLVRELQVDILVDLGGLTDGARTSALASRPAPVQVNYLGYPGTLGTNYVDYIIADRTVISETQRKFYSEKVVYLPDTYMAADSARKISERSLQRADCGLPETGFVFCSFSNNFKITPQIFDIWLRLLHQVEGSVLWLSDTNEHAVVNLRNEAKSRGVNAERIVFAQRTVLNEDHLARQHLADLALDTFPYTGHTTTSDALWSGVPLLTCQGETFAARVAASLLYAIDLPELITTSLDDYEHTAFDLAGDPMRLKMIRQKLRDHRSTAPLFNTKRFTAHIESAFAVMFERHRSGLAPDHFSVASENIELPSEH